MSKSGDRIRQMRIKNNYTLEDVAKRLDVGRQAIYKYEQGTVTNIPLDKLQIMAVMFGTTPGYLAGWSDDHPPEHKITQTVSSTEARIISAGIDKMPEERRQQALAIMQAAFVEYADFFKEETDK